MGLWTSMHWAGAGLVRRQLKVSDTTGSHLDPLDPAQGPSAIYRHDTTDSSGRRDTLSPGRPNR